MGESSEYSPRAHNRAGRIDTIWHAHSPSGMDCTAVSHAATNAETAVRKRHTSLRYLRMIRSKKTPNGERLTLQSALDIIPSEEWPIDSLLRLPGSPAALGRIFPAVLRLSTTSSEFCHNVQDTLRTFGLFAAAATRTNALILLSPVVDAVLATVESNFRIAMAAKEEQAVDIYAQHSAYLHLFLRSLTNVDARDRRYGRRRASELPSAVLDQCGRVVEQMLRIMEMSSDSGFDNHRLPTTSTPSPILQDLLGPQLLVSTTVEQLLDYCHRQCVQLSENQWRSAAAVLFRSGNMSRAISCLAHASVGHHQVDYSHRLMAAQGASSFQEALHVLEPIFSTGDDTTLQADGNQDMTMPAVIQEDRSLSRAWSVLASHAARDEALSAQDLVTLARSIPADLQSGYIITPALHGLIKRGDIEEATMIWKDMLKRHEAALPEKRPECVDAAALSVGAELQFIENLHEAARRDQLRAHGAEIPPYDPLVRPFRLVDHLGLQAGHSPVREAATHSIPLDSRVLSGLLSMCARSGRPGPAFRLWEAAYPRWGVRQDDASLALLLDTARLCADRGFDPGLDTLRGRLRALASAIKKPTPQPQPEVNWRLAPVGALLDPKRYSWQEEHGVQPWQKARDLFRSIVLDNWPELEHMSSPLAHAAGPFGAVADFLSPRGVPPAPDAPLPAPESKSVHLVPGQASWASYIFLLEHHAAEWQPEEIPQALAWMRALRVKPTWRAMATALMHVGEVEGARRRVRIEGRTKLARDEEILRAWLSEWAGNVPSEQEVASFRRAKAAERAERVHLETVD